jgi:hypothetical protein
VTNDLETVVSGLSWVADLHFLVELRGFEPLTPSMRIREAVPWDRVIAD